MIVERKNNEVIVRLDGNVDADSLQRTLNYLRYLELVSKSKATQEQIDNLIREVKEGWWKKNRSRFTKWKSLLILTSFSALCSPQKENRRPLFNSHSIFGFYAANFLRIELTRNREKLLSLSTLSENDLLELQSLLYGQITFIDESILPEDVILRSEDLISDVDPDDIMHVALSDYLNALLWTGDRNLIRGLESKGFKGVINTDGLMDLRNKITKS